MNVSREFFEGDTATVAQRLLGKILLSRSEGCTTSGKIVETEAYYGIDDPASRASQKKTKINKVMWAKPGTILVYMVHGNWLFNIVTGAKEVPSGVLIRALEPLEGIKTMKDRRDREKISELASGPGKLTEALGISDNHHSIDLFDSDKIDILIPEKEEDFEMKTSKRIGVKKDLETDLRFYIYQNKHVSRHKL